MCERCTRRWQQEQGEIPRDLGFYAEAGVFALGAILMAPVALAACAVMAPFAAIGWVADHIKRALRPAPEREGGRT